MVGDIMTLAEIIKSKVDDLYKTYNNLNLEYNNEKIESLKEDNNAQINIIKQLNEENRLLKNRPSKPTIEELERDKIFHGKRNKKTYKKCQNE